MSTSVAPGAFVRSADGTRIAYGRLGHGPPILIVHGGLDTSAGWGQVAERLAHRFEVLVFDRRGRSRSDDGIAPHALEREIEDVEALLHVSGPGVALIGHSFGGAVALETARRATPGQIAAAAVYEPAIGVAGSITPADIARMQTLIARGEPDAALDIAIAALDAAGLVSADPRSSGARRPDAVLGLAPTVPRELRAVTQPGLEIERYAALHLPALVLLGTRSPKPQQRICERLTIALPHARLARLDGQGHVAHTAAPDAVAAAIATFLGDIDQASQPGRLSTT